MKRPTGIDSRSRTIHLACLFTTLALIALPAILPAQTIEFDPYDAYGVASAPWAMATGDFNKDGHEDVAVAHDTNKYSILVNQGDGTFSATSYTLGTRLRDVTVIELSGDTIVDLAFSDWDYDGVRVLTGNGDGTFSVLTSIYSGNGADGIASGDFNGDGISDVCVCNRLGDNLGVLLGNTAGAFDAATNYPAGDCIKPAVGLMDGDSFLDIVVAGFNSANIGVLLGNGTGGFGSASFTGLSNQNKDVALGDINKDLKLDAVVISYANDTVMVLLGDGLGGLSLDQTLPVGDQPHQVRVADLNNNGWLDIVVTNRNSTPGLTIYPSDQAGGFGTPLTYHDDLAAYALAIADFDSISPPDIATGHNNGTVRILLSIPDTDGDSLWDWWEDQFACVDSLAADSASDGDTDGLTNLEEFNLATDPCNPDTDGDGMADGWEVVWGASCGLDPLVGDSQGNPDGDPFTNIVEYSNSTDPCVDEGGTIDSDSDGLTDIEEGIIGTEFDNPDTDGDGINDGDEYLVYLTDPTSWDSDDDTMPDNYEVNNSSGHSINENLDPLDPSDGGTTDFDSDTNPNVHEYWNGTDPWVWDPVCGEGCFCWGDANGDGVPDPTDIVELAKAVRGLGPNYVSVVPQSGLGQDMDGDGTPSPPDITELKKMVRGLDTTGLGSRPFKLVVTEQPGTTVAVGDTCHVTVGVLNDSSTYSPSFGVIFKIGAGSTGTASVLGGEGASASGRYDVSQDTGASRIVLKIESAGAIEVEASIPGCGIPTLGRYCPAISAPTVTITGE